MDIKKLFTRPQNRLHCNTQELYAGVRAAYSRAAAQPDAKHPFPVGREFAGSIGYPAELLDTLPADSWQAFTGVSNTSIFSDIQPGSTILDIGCGAGLDSLVAARRTGKGGKVIGIDFSEEMLTRAQRASRKVAANQADFLCAAAEELPLKDGAFDVVLANGIFNLNPNRGQVFTELSRVVKDGGKAYVAELVFTAPIVIAKACSLAEWFA